MQKLFHDNVLASGIMEGLQIAVLLRGNLVLQKELFLYQKIIEIACTVVKGLIRRYSTRMQTVIRLWVHLI